MKHQPGDFCPLAYLRSVPLHASTHNNASAMRGHDLVQRFAYQAIEPRHDAQPLTLKDCADVLTFVAHAEHGASRGFGHDELHAAAGHRTVISWVAAEILRNATERHRKHHG